MTTQVSARQCVWEETALWALKVSVSFTLNLFDWSTYRLSPNWTKASATHLNTQCWRAMTHCGCYKPLYQQTLWHVKAGKAPTNENIRDDRTECLQRSVMNICHKVYSVSVTRAVECICVSRASHTGVHGYFLLQSTLKLPHSASSISPCQVQHAGHAVHSSSLSFPFSLFLTVSAHTHTETHPHSPAGELASG